MYCISHVLINACYICQWAIFIWVHNGFDNWKQQVYELLDHIRFFFMNQYLQNDTYKAFISSVVTGIQFQHIESSLVYLASFYDANSLVMSTRNRHTALINIKLKHYRGVSLSDCGLVGHRI